MLNEAPLICSISQPLIEGMGLGPVVPARYFNPPTNLVLHCLPPEFTSKHTALGADEIHVAEDVTAHVLAAAFALLNTMFPDAYLASLFKNASKCAALKAQFTCPPPVTA